MLRMLVTLVLVLATASAVDAQQLQLRIEDGRVNLDAVSVPARQILAEWARVGGTKIVGAEKIAGIPLTLKLVDTPERQALDIILRNVAGFMAAPRSASAAPGASTYDRILILATTSAPAPAAANARPNASPGMAGIGPGGPRVPPRPPNLPPSPAETSAEDQQATDRNDTADTGMTQPVFTFPAPPGVPNGPGVPGQPAAAGPPVFTFQPNANGQPTIYNFAPNGTPLPAPTPTTPGFAVIGSPTPGLIQQPPQPAQQTPGQQQQPAPRPPGQR